MADMNPLLTQTEQQITAKVDPTMQGAFQKAVLAGKKVLYAPQTRQMVLGQLKQPGDPADIVGQGVTKLLAILINQSHGTLQPKAFIPAATVLLCEALDFAEKAGLVKVTPQVLAAAMHSLAASVMQLLKIDPQKLNLIMQPSKTPQPAQGAAQPAAAQPAQPQAAQPAPGGLVAQAQGAAA